MTISDNDSRRLGLQKNNSNGELVKGKNTYHLGQSIRMVRELRNFSQKFMAEELDLSLSGYGKLERGETDPSYTRLQRIAQILEVSVEELIRFRPMMFESNNIPSKSLPDGKVYFSVPSEKYGEYNENNTTMRNIDLQINLLKSENALLRELIEQLIAQL